MWCVWAGLVQRAHNCSPRWVKVWRGTIHVFWPWSGSSHTQQSTQKYLAPAALDQDYYLTCLWCPKLQATESESLSPDCSPQLLPICWQKRMQEIPNLFSGLKSLSNYIQNCLMTGRNVWDTYFCSKEFLPFRFFFFKTQCQAVEPESVGAFINLFKSIVFSNLPVDEVCKKWPLYYLMSY